MTNYTGMLSKKIDDKYNSFNYSADLTFYDNISEIENKECILVLRYSSKGLDIQLKKITSSPLQFIEEASKSFGILPSIIGVWYLPKGHSSSFMLNKFEELIDPNSKKISLPYLKLSLKEIKEVTNLGEFDFGLKLGHHKQIDAKKWMNRFELILLAKYYFITNDFKKYNFYLVLIFKFTVSDLYSFERLQFDEIDLLLEIIQDTPKLCGSIAEIEYNEYIENKYKSISGNYKLRSHFHTYSDDEKIEFGKHSGKTIAFLKENESDYLLWMIKAMDNIFIENPNQINFENKEKIIQFTAVWRAKKNAYFLFLCEKFMEDEIRSEYSDFPHNIIDYWDETARQEMNKWNRETDGWAEWNIS